MNKFIKGMTYAYNRNIGWQDRIIRTLAGLACAYGAYYFYAASNLTNAIVLGILTVAQLGTVFSARCIMCYFAGQCTIGASEKSNLDTKEIKYEN